MLVTSARMLCSPRGSVVDTCVHVYVAHRYNATASATALRYPPVTALADCYVLVFVEIFRVCLEFIFW